MQLEKFQISYAHGDTKGIESNFNLIQYFTFNGIGFILGEAHSNEKMSCFYRFNDLTFWLTFQLILANAALAAYS